MARLSGIEAARGIAAASVVLYHVARHIQKVHNAPLYAGAFQFGHAGVDLFFVISGFIILWVHYGDIGKPSSLRRYAARRFTRVMPTYWVALLLTILLHYAGSHVLPSFETMFWSGTLLPSNHNLVVGVAWTLRFELLFYAIVGVLIWNRVCGLALLAGWLILVTFATVSGAEFRWLPNSIYSVFNLEFFMGMAVAYCLRHRSVPAPRTILTIGVLLFAAVAGAEDLRWLDGDADWARLAYGPAAALIVLGAAEAGRRDLLLVPQWLQSLGSATYSIYLFQFVWIGLAWQAVLHLGLEQRLSDAALFLALAVPGVMGGMLMSRLVEQPLIGLLRSRRERTRMPVPAA
jgi:exopolysaccharide production protein ExoZ